MAKFDWKSVTKDDVVKAIDIFLKENPDYPAPKNTYLIYDGKKLPAKHIRGIAYKVAHNKEISKADYTGGMETVKFFEKRGFEVKYTGKTPREPVKNKEIPKDESNKKEPVESKVGPKDVSNKKEPVESKAVSKEKTEKMKIPSSQVIEQKNALQLLLNRMFHGDIVCEKTYEWMKTPSNISGEYKELYENLKNYRGHKNFAKKNVKLRCDFVCESEKIIIEYDERQHFSEARRISLLSYNNIPLEFDRDLWIRACEDIQAKDNNPVDRDETRAYYDATRDIEAYKNGYKLIRIMHGQIDFDEEGAYEKLTELIDNELKEKGKDMVKKENLRIVMYLQLDTVKNRRDFKTDMSYVKDTDIDILVFPEFCWTPFSKKINKMDITDEDDFQEISELSLGLSEELGCAVVINAEDCDGAIFSMYANAFAKEGETDIKYYVKHTATYCSAFDFVNYRTDYVKEFFEPIYLKGNKIGLTICYDCNHALFSRIYGLQNVDIILNSTGGNVKYYKWYRYNATRAIENNCYNFVTMGGENEKAGKKMLPSNCYVYGFNRNGKKMKPELLNFEYESDRNDCPSGLYLFDLSKDDGGEEPDDRLDQEKTVNNKQEFFIPVGDIDSILNKAEKLSDKLYVLNENGKNIIFCVINDDEIFHAENFLPEMYSEKLDKYKNRKYIIVNKYKNLSRETYENRLSVVLKVRAMENFCAVILESDIENTCYQTGYARSAQVVQEEDGKFGIDLSRTSGPDAIWKNKDSGMQAHWRENFAWLANEIKRIK